jgi:polyphosphate kinase
MQMASRYPPIEKIDQIVEFERRVLDEARNDRNPLLERVKFLGVLGGNLDERMMVHGRAWASCIGARRVARKTHALLRKAFRVLKRELLPALANAGLHVVDYASLTADEQAVVDARFAETALPHITPMREGEMSLATLPGLGLNLAVVFDEGDGVECIAVVRLPDELSILMHVDRDVFAWSHQVAAANVHRLFSDAATIRSTHPLRIIRDYGVSERDTHPVVMMVIDRGAGRPVVDRLARALDVAADAVVRARHVVDFKRLWDVAEMPRADLRYPPLVPQVPARVGPDLFAAMTSCCTIRSSRSSRWWISSVRPRSTPRPSASSRRSTAPIAASHPYSRRWSTPRAAARTCASSSS